MGTTAAQWSPHMKIGSADIKTKVINNEDNESGMGLTICIELARSFRLVLM